MSDKPKQSQASRYWAKIDAGMCGICGKVPPREPGTFHCETCLENKRIRRYTLRRLNLCENCKADTGGARLCETCLARERERFRIGRAERKATGQCRSCSNPVRRGSTSCAKCLRENRVHRRIGYYMLKHRGLCTGCKGRAFALPNRTRCAACAAEAQERERERDRKRNAPDAPRCKIEGCNLPIKALKLCQGHYAQQRRGEPFGPLRHKPGPPPGPRPNRRGLKHRSKPKDA